MSGSEALKPNILNLKTLLLYQKVVVFEEPSSLKCNLERSNTLNRKILNLKTCHFTKRSSHLNLPAQTAICKGRTPLNPKVLNLKTLLLYREFVTLEPSSPKRNLQRSNTLNRKILNLKTLPLYQKVVALEPASPNCNLQRSNTLNPKI